MYIKLTTDEMAQRLMEVDALGNEDGCYQACYDLCEWLQEIDDDSGVESEFDAIAIRCDYDYLSLPDIREQYSIEFALDKYWNHSDYENIDDATVAWLLEKTLTVLQVKDDRYVIGRF